MTRENVKELLAMMTSVYNKNLMPEVNSFTVTAWYGLLGDLDFKMTRTALIKWLSLERYPPTPSDLRGILVDSQTKDKLTAEQAWRIVLEAISKYGSYSEVEALLSLPDEVREIVKSFGWRHYCQMQSSDIPTYFAQFRNAYNAECKKQKERAQIPESVKKILIGMYNQNQITGKTEEER